MDKAISNEAPVTQLGELDLIDIDEVCTIIGGSKPVNRATVYRGIAAGTFPKPIKFGHTSRWLRTEWLTIVKARIADRNNEVKAA